MQEDAATAVRLEVTIEAFSLVIVTPANVLPVAWTISTV